jgi:hypothetical protein
MVLIPVKEATAIVRVAVPVAFRANRAENVKNSDVAPV